MASHGKCISYLSVINKINRNHLRVNEATLWSTSCGALQFFLKPPALCLLQIITYQMFAVFAVNQPSLSQPLSTLWPLFLNKSIGIIEPHSIHTPIANYLISIHCNVKRWLQLDCKWLVKILQTKSKYISKLLSVFHITNYDYEK